MSRTHSGSSLRIDRDQLLARINLGEVLDAFTPATGSGHARRWRCPEPSHPDEHPSVTVTTDRHGIERWRCWSGGHGGTAIDAVIAARHLTIGESIRWLNDHYTHLEQLPPRPVALRQPQSGACPSPDVIDHVERCEQLLWTRSGTEIRTWLNARGLTDDVLAANRVGADPGSRHLARRNGLPSGAPAAIFPALDPSGNITYFQSRFIEPASGAPKYANPARRLATNPGLAWTQPITRPRSNGPLVVTEGIPDALIAVGAGIRSVGVLGSMTPNHRTADRIVGDATVENRRIPRIVVCFDTDSAGRSGAARLIELLSDRSGIEIADVAPPVGMDLTDWAASGANWTDHLTHLDVTARALHPTANPERSHDSDIDFGP